MCHWTPSMLLTALQFPHMSTWGLQPSPDWLLGLIQRQPVVLSLPPYLPESSLSILGHGSSNHSTPTVYGHKRRIFLDQCESFPASPDCCSKWVENAVLQIHKTWKMTHMSLVSTATYCSSHTWTGVVGAAEEAEARSPVTVTVLFWPSDTGHDFVEVGQCGTRHQATK